MMYFESPRTQYMDRIKIQVEALMAGDVGDLDLDPTQHRIGFHVNGDQIFAFQCLDGDLHGCTGKRV